MEIRLQRHPRRLQPVGPGLGELRDLRLEHVDGEGGVEDETGLNHNLRAALLRLETNDGAGEPNEAPIQEALRQLAGQYAAGNGGFGGAPKFPHPGTLRFLLREGFRADDRVALDMALQTLEKMANGGINDQLGGGRCGRGGSLS